MARYKYVKIDPKDKSPDYTSTLDLPSMTEITSKLGKYGMDWYGYGVALDGVDSVLSGEFDLDELREKGIRAVLKEKGLSLWHVGRDNMQRGTRIHGIWERWAKSEGKYRPKIPKSDPIRPYVKALYLYISECKPKPYLEIAVNEDDGLEEYVPVVERDVWHRGLWYAGTLDCILNTENGLQVMDIKTRRVKSDNKLKSYPSEHVQVKGYSMAWWHMNKPRTNGEQIVLLGSNGDYGIVSGHAEKEHVEFARQLYDVIEGLEQMIKTYSQVTKPEKKKK